jgi:hypothetical protein
MASEWDVVNEKAPDPWTVVARKPSANAVGGVIPLPIRDVARGFAGSIPDIAAVAGYVSGSEGITRWSQGANNWLDRNIAPRAEFGDEPGRAFAQTALPALIPVAGAAKLIGTGVRAATTAALPTAITSNNIAAGAGGAAMRAAEIALPGSAPFTAGNIALNAGVGAGLSYGVEQLGNAAEEAKAARNNAAAGNSGFTPVDNRSNSEKVNDALPWVVSGLAVLSVGAAARLAQKAAADQAARASEGSFTAPGTPTASAPMTGVVERLENGLFNHNAILMNRAQEAISQQRMTKAVADDVIGTVITHANESATSDVFREYWNTGVLPGGIQSEAPTRIAEQAALLREKNPAPDPLNPAVQRDDYVRFQDLLAAADELDVRRENANAYKWMTNPLGGTMKGVPARSALANHSDADLRMRIAEARRNPEIAALEQSYRNVNNAILDYGHTKGIWSQQELADMRSKGPNYMHRLVANTVLQRDTRAALSPITTGTEGNSPLDKRNRKENQGPEKYQDPIMSMQDGIHQTLDFLRRNEAISNVARFMSERAGAANLSGIGRVLNDRPGTQHRKGYVPVTFRADNGTRYILELDPTISQGLLPYPRAFVPIANGARMLEQQLTTGPVGAILGNIQAPASAAMGTLAAAVNAPKHLRLGYIDKWLHQLSGGTVNLRAAGIVDPTYGAQVAMAFMRDFGDLTQKILSTSLQHSLDKNGMFARSIDMLGAGRAQAMADSFMNNYINSDLHRMHREGLQAQGLSYAAEGNTLTDYAARLNNLSQTNPDYAARMNYSGFSPTIGEAFKSVQQLREYMAVQSAQSGVIPGVNQVARTWQAYTKVLDLIANAPQSAIYRANKATIGQRDLIATARSITGDPSQYGGFSLVQSLLSMMPFGNITMQAGHQMYKAFKQEPAAFALRTAMTGTMLSVAMLQSAIFADEAAIANGQEPSAVAHMMTRDSRDAASAFRFYLPGASPESSLRMPIEQSFAPHLSAILGSVVTGFDVQNPKFYSGQYAPLRDSIHRLIEDGEMSRMRAAFGIAGGDIPMLGAADAAARIVADTNIENMMSLASGARTEPVRDEDGFGRQLINNDVTDRYTAIILETATGFGGTSLQDLWRTFGIANREVSAGKALSAVGEQYKLNLAGGARIVGPAMFGQERRLRSNDIIGESVKQAEKKLDDITKNMGQVKGGEGTIGPSTRIREAPYGGGRPGVPDDVQPVLMQLGALNRQLTKAKQQRTDTLTTMRSLASSPQLRANPARLRSETNKYAMEVRSINNMIYQRITDAEADLSEQTGRRVRISDLNPLKGLDQFPMLKGR